MYKHLVSFGLRAVLLFSTRAVKIYSSAFCCSDSFMFVFFHLFNALPETEYNAGLLHDQVYFHNLFSE